MDSGSLKPDAPPALRRNRVRKPNKKTPLSRYNARIIEVLLKALQSDPELDIAAFLGASYPKRRQQLSKVAALDPNKDNSKGSDPIIPSQNDTRSLLKPTDTAEILSPLSNELKQLLPSTSNLTESVIDLFSRAEVIFQQPWALSTMVLRVTADIVVKLSLGADDTGEYSALEYLQQHLPGFPFPKPHGLIKLSHYYLMFMTYIPGSDLEKAWPQLDVVQKSSISSQLNTLFLELRSLPHPENKQLGGLQGQGCKDGRRGVRVSSKPIMNVNDFEDFVLRSGFPNTTQLYRSFLQGVCPPMPYKPVFTHGDVRPANIMVDKAESGEWKVVGIVDWERAGFYPEYWESVKMTNNLTHSERWDWYAHFPDCLHPKELPGTLVSGQGVGPSRGILLVRII